MSTRYQERIMTKVTSSKFFLTFLGLCGYMVDAAFRDGIEATSVVMIITVYTIANFAEKKDGLKN